MTRKGLKRGVLALVTAFGVWAASAGAADETVRLWPGAAPGTETWNVKERTFEVPTKEFGALPLITDVSIPTLTVVRPAPAQANGTAVIVCPGGGFRFLSWESEGLEVARWLANRGITAFVLKYRVRLTEDVDAAGRKDQKTFEDRLKAAEPKVSIARADAIQAVRHLRAHADKYGIARDRIGLMGFSAGAMTTMSVVLKADPESRPNFAAPIYGAMEDAPLPKDAPPLFIVHTQADVLVPAAQSTKMFNAWTAAGRPAELHLYQAGPHGFGMRRVGLPVDGWTDAFEGWLRAGHLLDRRTTPKTTAPTGEKGAVGRWRLKYEPGDGQTHEPVLTITKDRSALKAEFIEGDQKGVVKEVRYKDGELRVKVETKYNGETATTTYAGKPDGDALKGEAAWEYQGMSGSFPFEGKREAEESQTPSVGAVPGKPSLAKGAIPKPRPITDPKVAHEALPELKFNVYYPRDIMERKTPVPVISWGNGGCRTFDWMSTTLLERWAAAGFVVVTYNDPAAKPRSVGVDAQTAAQVRMLDWAEKANAKGGRFAGKLDTQRMVVGGNSCGGLTAFRAAWADKRPKAIFIVSGSTQLPGVSDKVRKTSAGRVTLPTLYIVGGPEDIARTPVRLEYESLRPGLPAVLIERSSGDHVAVSTDPDIQRDEAAMAINWFRTILYGDKVAANELATKGCVACDPKVWSVRSKNLPGAADEKDAVGTWTLTYSLGDGEHKASLTVTKKEGAGLQGKFKDGDRVFAVKKVELKAGALTFVTETKRDRATATATFEGKVKGDAVEGEATWELQGRSGSFRFTGKREAVKPSAAPARPPSAVAVPGKPSLSLGNYDLGPLGYQVEEFFVSGTATSYKLKGKASADGKRDVVSAGAAEYKTRIVVARPKDPAKFSGTVVVEWLNVSGGFDMPVDWNMTHREILRRGHAYVGVSAQKAGLDALKKADAGRYGRLSHPGDAYSFDIFSQAGKLVKDSAASKVLSALVPQRVLAIGESQSAFYLTTYTAAVDPVAQVYDGILIHSRFGTAAPLDNTSMFAAMLAALAAPEKGVKLPPGLRVPVLTVITESDLLGWPPLNGYYAARQADTDKLRVWEIAGTAHADNYVFSVGFIDSGSLPVEKLAAAWAPTSNFLGKKLDQPVNFAPQHHYVVQAALWQLDRWVKTRKAAPKAPTLKLTADKRPKLVTDANGLAEGGLRTPWVDVPTATLSGVGGMVGFGKPFDTATLKRLYPGGKAEYLKKLEASLDEAIAAGFIVPEDKPEIMELAALRFHGKDEPAMPEGDKKAARDLLFKEPYVDKDEWRDKPVRHRYVHGGFKGTEARFSLYFPPKDRYQGRFFQHITAIPISENLTQLMTGEADFIGFSAESGGYFVETNEGGMGMLGAGKDPTIAGYRVNAAAARYSRVLAVRMYGPHRTYGYAFGASGGAFRTVAGAENTDVWDGVVPLVIGSPMALPNVFTVRALALRVLKDKLPAIVDAVEPGGSGDMYAGLNGEERAVLAEVTRMGFPPRAWFDHKTLGLGALPIFLPMVAEKDPKYFEDFWKVPGYAGADPPESLKRARIQHRTTVKKVVSSQAAERAGGGADAFRRLLGGEMKVQVESVPAGDLLGANLVVKTGAAAGKALPIRQVAGDVVTLGTPMMGVGATTPEVVKSIKAGDEVQVDNSDFLAVQYYHRHQVPTPDYYVWDQFRGPDGKPLYPQRPRLLGPDFAAGTAVAQTGRFHGKMIVVESLMDQDALPWQADWYRSRVKAALGPRLDENFRVWFTDHALHAEMQPRGTHTVGYFGVLHQVLRDLSAWVEKDVPPPASTSYKVIGGQVEVPPDGRGPQRHPAGRRRDRKRRRAGRGRGRQTRHLFCGRRGAARRWASGGRGMGL